MGGRGRELIGLILAAAAAATLLVGCTEGAASTGPASGETGPLQPAFHATPCDIAGLSPEIRPRLRCGTVSVPRNHDAPGAGRFTLAVVVVKSLQQPALPDPVVYINGGPGAPLTAYADHQARTPYAPRRDLVLVDQRGTGRSEPSLCPGLNDAAMALNLAVAEAVGTAAIEAALARRRATYAACRDSAIAHGIDLNDFGTAVTVADFEWVRRALGIERWNVYGESYGTTVAMTLAALHPAQLRAVVLDSVYPPDPGPLYSARVADAREAFFAACAKDPTCAQSFPDLAGIYRAALDRLDRHPLIVTVPSRPGRPDDQVRITASLFDVLVSNLIYYPTYYAGLPRLIGAVHDGNNRDLPPVLASASAAAASPSRATHVTVECRDRPRYRAPPPTDATVLDFMSLYGVCDGWSDLGPAPLVPAGTDVPTLVLAGEFDPNARPAFSRQLAEQIGRNARWVEFPRLGHNVRAFSPCGARIASAFIDDPAQALDTSCAARRPAISFSPARRTEDDRPGPRSFRIESIRNVNLDPFNVD